MASRRLGYEIFISGFIIVMLSMQAAKSTGLLKAMGIGRDRHLWPILSYHMYSRVRLEGDYVEAYDLVQGVRSDGSIVDISKEDLKLGLWHFRHMIRGLKDQDPGAIQLLTSRFASSKDLKEVRILSFPVMVTRDGPADKPSEILALIPLNTQKGE